MRKAMSLIEVVVAAVILTAAFAGLLAAFTAVRGYIERGNRRLVAVNLARNMSNYLYKQALRGEGDFTVGQHPYPISVGTVNGEVRDITIDGIVYKVSYIVNEEGNIAFSVHYPEL